MTRKGKSKMTTYYKAVRPDGTDFYSGSVQWTPPSGPVEGWEVKHPTSASIDDDASTYLSVATVPTDCTGMRWPCRLLAVEACGDVIQINEDDLPNKRAGLAFRVVEELPAHRVFGPQGKEVAALIERVRTLTGDEMAQLGAAWDAAWDAARNSARDATQVVAWDAARETAWDVAWDAAQGAAWDAARNVAWDAAWDAAQVVAQDAVLAVMVRDLITEEQYNTLIGPWVSVTGNQNHG